MALHPGFVTSATTTALDTRLAEMGFIVRNADGSPRLGVLWDGGMNGFLVVTTAATSPMTLLIPTSSYIVSRGSADGVCKITSDGGGSVNVATAPATGQSRIDVVWVKQNDSTQGDADNLAVYQITAGVAASTGSQTKPAIPTGALELATLLVGAGQTSTNAMTLTQTFGYTGVTGAIIPFPTLAQLKAWTPENVTYARSIQAGNSIVYVYDSNAGVWHPLDNAIFAVYGGTGSQASGTTDTTATVTSVSQSTNDSDIISAASGVPQVLQAGFYRLTATIVWQSNATGVRSLRFTQNDTNLPVDVADVSGAVSGFGTAQSITTIVQLNANDYVKAKVFQNSGSTLTYQASLSVEVIR
jgi:hypothetical protein